MSDDELDMVVARLRAVGGCYLLVAECVEADNRE